MNKRELIDQVCTQLATTKAGAEETVNAVLGAIQQGIAQDGEVALAGFGSFVLRRRPERLGRNPQNGASIQIGASASVLFHPARGWKESLRAPS